ncbi:hypothetical protein XELAEV_18036461mg [Xenopus laevis]|uniref:Uncharacterized protein n=1 Tax=Xenopus laevis TaxID=8355 RepID=A0A974CHF9_XENLA|nr:hypothetical protein XELAEV_18036461mg [Xenopus laevis]
MSAPTMSIGPQVAYQASVRINYSPSPPCGTVAITSDSKICLTSSKKQLGLKLSSPNNPKVVEDVGETTVHITILEPK